MKLQMKPLRWLCAPTAFAMAVDIDVADFLQRIGHDGSEMWFPTEPEPQCRRGIHVQECISVCDQLGFAVTPIELFPCVLSPKGINPSIEFPEGNWDRFTKQICGSTGVISGIGRNCGHAVAYDYGRIYDPDGNEYDYTRDECERRHFYTQCLWRVDRIRNFE